MAATAVVDEVKAASIKSADDKMSSVNCEAERIEGLNQIQDDSRECTPESGSEKSTPQHQAVELDNQGKKKIKKREDRGIEQILKTLQNLETSEEKLAALCKKYTELLEEHKSSQNLLKQSQRSLTMLNREKDQLQSEHSKAVLAKSKLEGLCRELQRHNKLVKDESIARAKEDDEKRKEVTTRFQTTINEIQQQMNDHYQKNTSLREENIELAKKLKGLVEQYELREQHIEKVLKTKDIETQLYDAKLQQAALQMTEEKELFLQEKQKFLHESMDNQKKIFLLEEQEKQYKAQVEMYSERYEEFQSTLTKSNDVFNTFKTEMDKMTKKIKKLEKDTVMWRQKWESSNKALLSMAEEKSLRDKESSLLHMKVSKLESLCRALQEERKKYTSHGKPADDISKSALQLEVMSLAEASTPAPVPEPLDQTVETVAPHDKISNNLGNGDCAHEPLTSVTAAIDVSVANVGDSTADVASDCKNVSVDDKNCIANSEPLSSSDPIISGAQVEGGAERAAELSN